MKPGGMLAIVFPETYLGMPSYRWIPYWLSSKFSVRAVIAMPEELFQPYTHNKTCILFVEKRPPRPEDKVFLADVRWCGKDSRGKPIPKDEIPEVARRLRKVLRGEKLEREDRLGRLVPLSEIKDAIFIPKYYDPEVHRALEELKKTHDLVPFGKLVEDGVLDIETGVEVGKLAYGTGTIPFIRTSDLSNWEVKIDPKHGVRRSTKNGKKSAPTSSLRTY